MLRLLFLPLLLVLASSCSGYRQPSPDGLVFAGLEHKDLGGADVDLELVVDGFGPSGQDGLATNVEPAREWEVDIRLVGIEQGATITYSAVTDRPVSTMVWGAVDSAVVISASFERSPTYSLEISNEGTTVLRLSALPNAVSSLSVIGNDIRFPDFDRIDICDVWPRFCEPIIVFRLTLNPGACQWEINFRESLQFDTAEGVVRGDRILLTEEHEPEHAHDAMVFTEMRIQAGGLSSIRIRDERVERPR